MTKIMTPSAESKTMTVGQIDKATGNYRALLEKHSHEFDSKAVQEALGQPELANKMFALFRACVEAISNMIMRCVAVNRKRTPQQALDATGRRQYIDQKVVEAMPGGEGEEIEVTFFKVGRYVDDNDLEKEYELRGLKPVDPYSLAAVNEADLAFADTHPNGTHWKDNGEWCFAAFLRWYDERRVRVFRDYSDWRARWWFAGVRK